MKKIRLKSPYVYLPLLLILGLLSYFGWTLRSIYQVNSQLRYFRPSADIATYKKLDNDAVVVKWKDKPFEDLFIEYGIGSQTMSSGNGLVLHESAKLFDRPTNVLYRNQLLSGEYWYVTVYDFSGSELASKTIDVMKTVRDYDSNYFPSSLYLSGGYMFITARSEDRKDKTTLVVDGKTGQVVSHDRFAYLSKSTSFSVGTTLHKKLEKVNVNMVVDGVEVQNGEVSKTWKISNDYPEVSEILANGGTLHFLGNGKEGEWDTTANILQLFSPDGADIFNGVTIEADYTTDGKAHTVKSYAEFKKYYKQPENGGD